MNTIVVDTHKTIQKLVTKGFTQEQAEGIVEAITDGELLTKDYFEAQLYKALLIHGLAVVGAVLGGAFIIVQILTGIS